MDTICVLFLLCSLSKYSFASVVFDFNASLIDVAPLSPILFPVNENIRMECWWIPFVCHFFCLHFPD